MIQISHCRSFLIGAILALAPVLFAQSGDKSSEITYFLGAEDQLSIHVVDLDDVSEKPFRIDPSGYIDAPMIGHVHVSGLSVDQLKAILVQRLRKFITDPQITINVLEYRSQPVSVLGEVNNPGVHLLQGPKHLVDVISSAGGLKADAGPSVTVTRQARWGALPLPNAYADASGKYSIAKVSLDDITSGKSADQNIEVRADDVISVPRADLIYVVGEVKKSGGFSLDDSSSISLIRALSRAEGMSPGAAPKKARILRASSGTPADTEGIPVDLQMILAGKAPDQLLHANDVLFIPNNVAGSALKRAAEAAVQIATGVVIFH